MMTIPTTTARVLLSFNDEHDRFLPEGPRNVVVDGRPALMWVNIQTAVESTQGAVHLRFWDNGDRCVLPSPKRPGFVLPSDEPNVVVIGCEKEIGTLNLRTGDRQSWAVLPDTHPRTIINDGEVVPGGRAVVFGTKDVNFAETIAHLYLFTLEDRRLSILASRQTCSNGKVIVREADELVLYDIDTPTRRVMRYRLDLTLRQFSAERVAVDLSRIEGFPDGMVQYDEDSVVIAMYHPTSSDAGHAHRFSLRTGRLMHTWTLPGSPRVTCPLLVQQENSVKILFTTATEGMPPTLREKCSEAGNLFIADTDLKTVPAEVLVRLKT